MDNNDQIPEHLKETLNTPELRAAYLDTSKVTGEIGPKQLAESMAQTKSARELVRTIYGIVDEIERLLDIDRFRSDLQVEEAVGNIAERVRLAIAEGLEEDKVIELKNKLYDLDFYFRMMEAVKEQLHQDKQK